MVHSFAGWRCRAASWSFSGIAAAALIVTAPSPSVAAEKTAPAAVSFNRDIRPLLSDNCFYCHGPDANHRQADLRLDIRDAAIDSGAIVPGEPVESLIVERIHETDPELVMPPPESHKKLTAAQKELLARWIEQGAEYQPHWAYVPPVKQPVPEGTNPVDHFVQRRLAEVGLPPSPPADRRTLARRLAFDLTGLPPNPEQVAAFANDPSPDADATFVEQLLASPHYGERMAIGWLDVVRFADTIGYHSDNPRNVWPYRDWVIDSFNSNRPFDEFTIHQLAGDLIPEADQSSRVGSAFNRLLLSTEEGGAQAKDYEARMLTDRVRAVGTVWLGQTTGCAQCHDHKFDPFTMRDFYSLGAFFADIEEKILGRREDGMVVATPEEKATLAALDKALGEARHTYYTVLPELVEQEKRDPSPKLKTDKAVQRLLKINPDKWSEPDKRKLAAYFLPIGQTYKEVRQQFAAAEKARNDFYGRLAKCLVSVHTDTKRTVRILPRGDWMNDSGEVVGPALPAFLPRSAELDQAAASRELTRLDLARWLVAKENPLTARVIMNRLWAQFFGVGLSRVLDDLGGQGEPPTHPDLLDWLACEFRDSGWDIKHMIRLIVSSGTYQQSSRATQQLLTADPTNRELARQTAYRVDAELVRDAALEISGLLVPTIGGPSVKPYQPAGYWENLNFPRRTYPADSGDKQHRRGLYTWWQRSFLHPSMLAFDAPSREECCASRNRSNIPQQALVLLNDPTYVEAARAFATRIVTEADESDEARLAWAFQQAVQRLPRVEEQETLLPLLAKHRAAYRADPDAAKQLVATGQAAVPADLNVAELAAWTHIARVLFNLHETITRS